MRIIMALIALVLFLVFSLYIIGFGFPILGVFGFPAACYYVLPKSTKKEKIFLLLAFSAWSYFLIQIFMYGYVSRNSTYSSPTVTPIFWVWVIIPYMLAISSKRFRLQQLKILSNEESR